MPYWPGNVVHLEIPSPDIAVQRAFYGAVFGWTFQPLHDRYELFDAGNIAGGLDSDKRPSTEAGTVLTIYVEEIDQKLAEITAAGGTILQHKTPIPGDMGWYGYFADPSGNRIGLWMPPPTRNRNDIGHDA